MATLWDKEADVVILGYGGAGAAAAISACDAGAKVIVVEKDRGGGNTRLATLTFFCPAEKPAAIEHIRALSFGMVDVETISAFVDWSSKNFEFIRDLGGEVEICPPGPTFPKLPGSDSMVRYRVKGEKDELGGASLWRLLSENVLKRNIEICFQTAARKLVRSGDAIAGVETEQGAKIHARRGVVLATGGFEYNEEMKKQYLAGYPIHAFGHSGNQGDGIKMAQEVGADLWHMRAVAAPMGYKFPEYDAAFIMRMPANGFVIVDQKGRRFCNETGLEHYSMWMEVTRFDMEELKYSRIPCYLIFDEETRLRGPISRVGHGANRGYEWSPDNSAEIERGWIVSGDGAAELGRKLGIASVAGLKSTLTVYQDACRMRRDEEFGRAAETLVALKGRLYGVSLWPCLLNTQGGPRRNARGEILDVWGNAIKRLYGAGELGSVWGLLYQSGGNLGECLASGRMAGSHAASETPVN